LLVLNSDQYNSNCIYLGEKSKNNIIQNSYFYNITYINDLFTMSQLFIQFQLKDINVEAYYNKYKIFIKNYDENMHYFKKLCYIEKSILDLFNTNKNHNLKLQYQIDNNCLKCTNDDNINHKNYVNSTFLIKISGIWENNDEIGLIYKLIIV